MTDANKEFDLDLNMDDLPEPTKKAPKKAAAKAIDPEDDRDNWPIIQIDAEEGRPNFEFLGVQGTKQNGEPFDHYLRVQRGVDVPVPPSVVRMLQNAVATHMKQVRNAQTGLNDKIYYNKPSVSWRLVKGGKYC